MKNVKNIPLLPTVCCVLQAFVPSFTYAAYYDLIRIKKSDPVGEVVFANSDQVSFILRVEDGVDGVRKRLILGVAELTFENAGSIVTAFVRENTGEDDMSDICSFDVTDNDLIDVIISGTDVRLVACSSGESYQFETESEFDEAVVEGSSTTDVDVYVPHEMIESLLDRNEIIRYESALGYIVDGESASEDNTSITNQSTFFDSGSEPPSGIITDSGTGSDIQIVPVNSDFFYQADKE